MEKPETISQKTIVPENPEKFGLAARYQVGLLTNGMPVLLIARKTRIIMKDGLRIMELLKTITKKTGKQPSFAHTGPICSKTLAFLRENDITVYKLTKD